MKFLSIFLLAGSVGAFAPAQTGSRSTALFDKPKVFIDGEAGTTGIQVRGRLEKRDDLEIISPPDELRKDPDTRKKFINEADAVILCKFKAWLLPLVIEDISNECQRFFLKYVHLV